jgi:hypothetical protein
MTVFAEERRVQRYDGSSCKQLLWYFVPPAGPLGIPARCPTLFLGGDHLFDSRTYAGSAWANDLLIDAR